MAARLYAQDAATGAISGVVYDPSNRVVTNAEVLAVNEATHISRSIATTSEGVFRVPLLPPGTYSVTVKVAGFAVNTSQSIHVTVSETTSLNVTLAIAGVNQSVQVKGGASVAELESSTLGGLVNDTAIQALPLSNRNYTQIMGLSSGVVVALPSASALGSGSQNVTSNGGKTTANNIQFNGIDANNLAENSTANASEEVGTAIPAPDSIQEFRVQTANFDAAYGRGSGANVDLVSKSGTNRFHGSAWEFVRNNIFNANDFFAKADGQPRADLKQNQFGGSVGGPIVKDKTFFFVEYQGSTQVNGLGGAQTATLPQLTSDRSAATLGEQFCPAGHLDSAGQVATGYLTQAGGTQVACDGSNINPVALAILNAKLPSGQFAVPSPQVALASTSSDQLPVGQSTFAPPAHYREDQFTVDIDQILSQKNTLAGRFFYSRATTTQAFSEDGPDVPGWGSNGLARNTMFVLSDTHTFNSNLVNIARFGYVRFDGLMATQNPLLASAIGQGTTTGAADPTSGAPGLSISGLFTIGAPSIPSAWQVTNTFVWQDTVSLTRGRHNMRFGAEFKRHELDKDSPEETSGLLQIATFDDFLLGLSAAQNGSPTGLSNVTGSQAGGGIFRSDERYTDFASFAQDDWKLTPRLTVNAGIRYEIFGAPLDTDGRLANFDPNIATGQVPAAGSFSGFTVPSNFHGTIPVGVTQTSFPGFYVTPKGDVSPRLGFVWQMAEKPVLVLRGGYGIYYDRHSGGIAGITVGQAPFSSLQIVSGAANGAATLQSPFDPLVPPVSSYPIFSPRTPTSVPFIQGSDPNLLDSQTQEYNLNVQYAFANDYVLQVGYVGTRSLHRPGQVEFDQALLASPQDPVNGETTNSVNNVTNRLPFAGISQGSLFTQSNFVANYNSLQSSIAKRFGHGLQFQGSYTWSKSLDETSGSGGSDLFELFLLTNDQHNPRQAYGLTDFDRAQRAVLNFIWMTPKFQSAPALARHLLTDWQFSGIAVIQSGNALTILDSNAGAVYGNFENRAQATGLNPSTKGSLYSRVKNGYLNQNAFTLAPEAPNGTGPGDTDFGDSGVGIVRGPGQHNLDMAVERVFPVKESQSFRFRAEFFNLTNTPQFSNPNTSVDYTEGANGPANLSPSFGLITSSAANPRIIQFALKYAF
jgi:Carboxypeptidase regulatory-like domain/TonB dependent receptor